MYSRDPCPRPAPSVLYSSMTGVAWTEGLDWLGWILANLFARSLPPTSTFRPLLPNDWSSVDGGFRLVGLDPGEFIRAIHAPNQADSRTFGWVGSWRMYSRDPCPQPAR